MRQHLYLHVAKDHLAAVREAYKTSRPSIGELDSDAEASSHIRDAVVAVVFAAMAVEFAVAERLTVAIALGTSSKELRQALLGNRKAIGNLPFPVKVDLLVKVVPALADHAKDAKDLAEIRNELAHGRWAYREVPEYWMPNTETRTMEHITVPEEQITSPAISTQPLEDAEKYVPVAEAVVRVLALPTE